METSAVLSPCRQYRYALWRKWADGPQVLFVMLNPSTADESVDDPTIRRCISFAKAWGFGSLSVGNLFAFNRMKVRVLWPYLALGGVLWVLVFASGIHATLAGVAVGRGARCAHLLGPRALTVAGLGCAARLGLQAWRLSPEAGHA